VPGQAFFDVHHSPIPGEDGTPAGVLAVLSETTGAVLARRARDQETTRLAGVLDGMDEAFGLMDRDFRILSQNAEARRLDPRPAEEVIGQVHWDAYPGSEDSDLGRLYKRAMAERAPATLEHPPHLARRLGALARHARLPVAEGLASSGATSPLARRPRSGCARARRGARGGGARAPGARRGGDPGDLTLHVQADRFVCDEPCARAFGLDPEAARRGVPLSLVLAAIHPKDVAGSPGVRDVVETGGRSTAPTACAAPTGPTG
jgi:hypothetical protein